MPNQADIVNAVASALQQKDLSQQAVMVIGRATEKVLKRVQQNVQAELKEDTSPIVEEFCRTLATKLVQQSQDWYDGVRNEMVVLPEGTRFAHRDKGRTQIVIEQPPQVRTISFNYLDRPRRLAFPYVVFVLSFQNHQWTGPLRVGFRKKSLDALDNHLMLPALPNITAHQVCMGNSWTPPQHDQNITQQAQSVIGAFWQSSFSHDGSEVFSQFCQDNDLNLDSWERRSKNDSLFVIDRATVYRSGNTVRDLLSYDNPNVGTPELVVQLKQEILQVVGEIGGEVQKLLENTNVLKENRSKVHAETLQEILKEIITQAYAELWEFLNAQLQRERAKLFAELETAANKLRRSTYNNNTWNNTW